MIYGDEPQQIGEYKDPLGTSRYTYAPQITAVMQAGNLYGYCVNNPIHYADYSGESIILACILIGSVAGAVIGGFTAAEISKSKLGYVDGKWVLTGVVAGTLIGGLIGFGIGEAVAALGLTATAGSGGTLGSMVLDSWKQAEEYLRNTIGSVSEYAARVFSTPFGNRVVDAYNKTTNVIAEAKYGYACLTDFIQSQIDKDAYLLNSGIVDAVEWHFFVSQTTGIGGPSAPLLEELIKQGFIVIFH